jgi:hypothetical protein
MPSTITLNFNGPIQLPDSLGQTKRNFPQRTAVVKKYLAKKLCVPKAEK